MNKINKNFIKSSHYISDLKLCSVRLIDNQQFPWIILIPKRKGITDITELNSKDQILLMKEIVYVSKLMKKVFKTKKLNVEKIGNIVPQLHIHIIARSKNDTPLANPSRPGPAAAIATVVSGAANNPTANPITSIPGNTDRR